MEMKHREEEHTSAATAKQENSTEQAKADSESHNRRSDSPARKKRFPWRSILVALVVIALLAGVGRALMPWVVRDYVNRTLDRNPLYAGEIGKVRIHLWRGAYSINDLQISKTSGNVPVPLFAGKRVDFAIQWNALWH